MLERFTPDTFAPHVETTFRVQVDAGRAVEIKLIRVEDFGSTPTRVHFSLQFRGPLDSFLQQQIYSLEHAALGTIDLFLVPIAREASGYMYEAVFNN